MNIMLRPSKYRCHFCEFSSLFSFQGLSSKQSVFCGFFFAAQLNRASSDGHWTRTQPRAPQRGPWLDKRTWRRIHWILESLCIILPPSPADNPIYFLSSLHFILVYISSKILGDMGWDLSSPSNPYLLSLIDLFLGACLAPLSLLTLLEPCM